MSDLVQLTSSQLIERALDGEGALHLGAVFSKDGHSGVRRVLHVTLSLNQGQTTDVTFQQDAQAIDEGRTRFVMFPPLNAKNRSLPFFTLDHGSSAEVSITKTVDAEVFPLAKKRQRWSVSTTLDPHDMLIREGIFLDDESRGDAVCLLETSEADPRTHGTCQWFHWPPEKLHFRCVDKEPNFSLSNEPYLLVSASQRIDSKMFTLRYSLEDTLDVRSRYLITINATSNDNTSHVARSYIVVNNTDMIFDRIDQITIVDTTMENSAIPQYSQ